MRPDSAGRIVILHEDDDIVAVDKPEGLPAMAPEGSRSRNLYDIVTAHIRKTNPKGRAAIVHRLDRDTSGVMVFAKNARAKKRLMENWDGLVKERGYTALASGLMDGEEGVFDSWLAESAGGQVHATAAGTRGSLRAITRWRTIQTGKDATLLDLRLETGRKHQIRVQLAEAGHPVAGDPRYGGRIDPLGRLALHAHLLVLEHPFTGEVLRLESPAPASFRQALAGIRASMGMPVKRPDPSEGESSRRQEGRNPSRSRTIPRDDDGYRKRAAPGGNAQGSRFIPSKSDARGRRKDGGT